MMYLFQTADKTNSHIVYQGPGISSPHTASNTLTQNFARAILHGGKFQAQLLQSHAIKTILLKPNPTLLQEFRQQLQLECEHLAAHPPQNESEAILWQAYLGNLIAILPFTYPSNGELIKIPVYKDGICSLIEYQIHVMQLHESEDYTSLTALGLTPTQESNGRPILSYLGTTYPAGNGFLASIFSDFTPQCCVGESTYLRAKNVLEDWFKDKQQVHLIGISLGGALAFHTLQDYHEKLQRVDVYNPPSLYAHYWKKEFHTGCIINIYQQPFDIVSWVGAWPQGERVNLYYVSTTKKPVHHNLLTSHIRAYTGFDSISIKKLNPIEENKNRVRKFITLLHFYLGPLFVFYPTKLLLVLYKAYLAWKKALQIS